MTYNWTQLDEQLLRELADTGAAGARDLSARLGISRSTFRRLVERAGPRLLVVGQSRATRYAARRTIADVGERVPVYRIGPSGESLQAATLHATLPASGFYCESFDDSIPAGSHADLPFFLSTLRPAGFLGRLIPGQHAELGLPQDIRHWSGDRCLRYLTRFGWNLPGEFIVGDEALALFLRHTSELVGGITPGQRDLRYLELAENVLEEREPGSSAGGEKPKFLATLEEGPTSVLVKFSPPLRSELGRREADLLVAESCAHRVLAQRGIPSARSQVIVTSERLFLEVERFDRIGLAGRRGFLALEALDAEYLGLLRTWSETADGLHARSLIDAETRTRIHLLELFGSLIGNSDMHLANMALLTNGTRIEGLAPVYDMLPMRYAPRHGQIDARPLPLPEPHPSMADVWDPASEAALTFWREATQDEQISGDFRSIAAAALEDVAAWRVSAQRLPRVGNLPSR